MQIIIVGGSIAGIQAAIECRMQFQHATITLIEQRPYLGHYPKSLFQGLTQDTFISSQPAMEPNTLSHDYQINVRLGLKCERLRDHSVECATGECLEFDKLILATGSTQRSRLVGTTEAVPTYWSYRTLPEQHEIYTKIQAATSIAIIGAGALGLAFASALAHTKKTIHLYERNARPLAQYFDADMTPILSRFLQMTPLVLHFSESVEQILPYEDSRYNVQTTKGNQIVDLVLVAVNTRPIRQELTTPLAKNSDGTLWVDDYLQTSQTDVFAIGDAIHVRFRATGEELYISSLENAHRTAYIVACNLSRLTKKDPGSIRPFEAEFFNTTYLSLGLLEQEAVFVSYPVAIQSFKLDTTTLVKVIYQKRTRQLLGIQVVAQTLDDAIKDQLYDAVDQAVLVDEWMADLERAYRSV